MAHPNLLAPAYRPCPVKQRAVVSRYPHRRGRTPDGRRFDRTAELVAQQLLPIADPQHRDAQVEHLRREGRHSLMHRRRPPREDNPARLPGGDPVGIRIERPDFAVNPRLAQPPGDQLGDLAAKVQDQNTFGGVRGIRQGIGHWVSPALDPAPWTMRSVPLQAVRHRFRPLDVVRPASRQAGRTGEPA